MKKFFAAIGQFLKTNYWLQPLLLVVIVFVLVFSLQGFDSVIESIKNWISPHSKCSECTSLKYDKAKARVQALEKIKPSISSSTKISAMPVKPSIKIQYLH